MMGRFTRLIGLWLLGIVVALGATGCRETADLGETSWALVAYGPADAPIPAEATALIHFEDNGRMGGHTGCNAFYGHYEAIDGRLTFRNDEMAFTTMGCDLATPEGRQDAFFHKWLGGGADYSQSTEQLILYFDEGKQAAEYRLSGD
jgi:heat shock protein HslJ